MKWEQGRRSGNVEDRRGMRMGGGPAIGGGALLFLLAATWLMGGDPMQVLQSVLEQQQTVRVDQGPAPGIPEDDPQSQFVSVVLADTEDTWTSIFSESGQRYEPPRLVLFSDAVQSACGTGSAAMGPFYCPGDQKVYIDLSFYDDLRKRFGAPGDFAQAYVIAHEVGHHVQNLLGIADKVHRARQSGQEDANELSVRLELQADCLAGVWGHTANRERQLLEEGDVEEGLAAAAAIGDDRLQKQSQGRVSPESWTHGSSEQRVRWFRRGLESGRMSECETFTASTL